MDKAGITPALSQGVLMEKLLYFVGGIIVGSIRSHFIILEEVMKTK